jgi:acylphosphatase
VIFFGRVQGVGFRATTRHIAQSFEVAGYVRNLPDGSVEVVAEGEREELDRFLDRLNDRMAEYIHSAEVRVSPATGGFQSFRIVHRD